MFPQNIAGYALCSKYFLQSDFKNINGQRLHLKNDAVPSIFCTQNQIPTKSVDEKMHYYIIYIAV